jgi:hypothetical protein
MKNIIFILMLLSLWGCKDAKEELVFFPISKECQPRLDKFVQDTKEKYLNEDARVYAQYEFFNFKYSISNAYIGTVKIFGTNLTHDLKESLANTSSALCVRTEQMVSENSILGFRGMREYLLTNLEDGETATVRKQGDEIVVSITKPL